MDTSWYLLCLSASENYCKVIPGNSILTLSDSGDVVRYRTFTSEIFCSNTVKTVVESNDIYKI